jgi:serine/threonine protein kinase
MPHLDDSGEHSTQPEPLARTDVRVSGKASERFVFETLLGEGASGAVYRAYDRARGATVAVKFLTAVDPASLFRFKSEFRVLANLSHPNLLQLYELLTYDDDWLLTMELVNGTDFLSYVRPRAQVTQECDEADADTAYVSSKDQGTADIPAADEDVAETELDAAASSSLKSADPDLDSTLVVTIPGTLIDQFDPLRVQSTPRIESLACPFDEERLRNALLQLCEGLAALHRADRLHRDLKPANVLVSVADARVVICDFGLALEAGRSGGDASDAPGDEQSRFELRQREIAGTLPFMSPEQARAKTLTTTSDWYSVGVMLYLALTGRLPFAAALSYNSSLRSKLRGRPVHPAVIAPGVPGELAELALAMLHPDPRQRAGYNEVLTALDGKRKRALFRARTSRAFLGRERQLSMLRGAFSASCSGAAMVALVSGTSGMGKSALVQHFLARLESDANAIVLRARCYEREELPYKAIDPLIDAMASHLQTLDVSQVRELLLRSNIRYLAALFPALKRVNALAQLLDEEDADEIRDLRERKRLAFRAFRELCKRLARQRPLVLFIDDLQWGDRDSSPLFQELIAGPDAPPVLIVCAYRSEDEARSPLVALLKDLHKVDESLMRLVDVQVTALSTPDAARLAKSLLEARSGAAAAADLIAREAEGSPFFVRELAAFIGERGIEAATNIRLDTVIQTQLDALARDTRDLLALIAVAGRPTAQSTLTAASQLGEHTFKVLRELEGRRLVLTKRSDVGERIECYHDRIRETACKVLTAEQTRALHRSLALALQTEAIEDCDALFEHWRGAGERDQACHYALKGASKAEAAMAFSRAADLYRAALSLLAPGDPRRRDLMEDMGHALIGAGRGVDAAAAFQELIPGANAAQGLKLRMLATTQLLRGGKISAGFAELARAEDMFGVRLPRSEAKALAMLLSRRLRIRLKEKRIGIHPSHEHEEEHARLAALWEVAAAVTSADWIRGGIYGAELMLRAIKSGDPSHIAGACGLEAVVAAAANDIGRTQRMIELAERAAQNTGNIALIGRVRGMRGVCCQLLGRWCDSVKFARESQDLSRRASQVTWDLAIMTWWEITSSAFAGSMRDLTTLVPQALSDAEGRGDVFAATSFRTHRCCWAWLGVDRPELADHHVEIAERDWTPSGYQFQHWHMAYSRSDVDLYRGTPRRSLERVTRAWKRGRLLRQVTGVRVDMLYTRGRLALAVAREARDPALVARANADARELQHLNMPWSSGLGTLLLAGAASFDSPSEAMRLTSEAEQQFRATDMALHVETARVRRGQLQGRSEGQALVTDALDRIVALGVKRPEAFIDMLAPFDVA